MHRIEVRGLIGILIPIMISISNISNDINNIRKNSRDEFFIKLSDQTLSIMLWKKTRDTNTPPHTDDDNSPCRVAWGSILLFSAYISSVLLLTSSNYFDSQLPVKVSTIPADEYSHPSPILEKIYGATQENTLKIIEPSLTIDHKRVVFDIIVYEVYNDSSNIEEELPSYTTGIILLEELEHPFKNYFGLNRDYYYDLSGFFEETISSLYFDEVAEDFEESMNLENLIRWLEVNNVLRFILFILLLLMAAVQIIVVLTTQDRFKTVKKYTLFSINVCVCLSILGIVTCLSLINHRYPSALNGFNLLISVLTLIIATLSSTFIFL